MLLINVARSAVKMYSMETTELFSNCWFISSAMTFKESDNVADASSKPPGPFIRRLPASVPSLM